MDLIKLKQEQVKLARKVIVRDQVDEIKTVAGCDIAYTNDNIVCAIIVMDYPSMKVREFKTTSGRVRFPYISGYLSYREAPLMIETYHQLEMDPDVMIVDGNGILHPRKMGLACYMGLSLDKPTIGVAKNLLVGELEKDSVVLNGDVIGKLLETKHKAKPIYVSPGHKVSMKTAVKVIKETLLDHKLPEPLHQAHKLANKVRKKLKGVDE